ncbi:MAG: hypothetical protein ABJN65_00955 [Parasphingorhabdus sp.]
MKKHETKSTIAATASLFLVLASSPPANAAAASCYGTLSGAYTTADGGVIINGTWRGAWTKICSLNSEWNGVPAQTCWAWFSQANQAVAQSKPVRIYYQETANVTCDQIPTYSTSPAPYYVMLIDG